MQTNCVVCALISYVRLRRRWRERGAPLGQEPYLLVRASRLGPSWMPHVLVGLRRHGRLIVWSYKPVDSSPLPWWRWWQALRFDGRVVRGD